MPTAPPAPGPAPRPAPGPGPGPGPGPNPGRVIVVYSRPDCHLCEQAMSQLRALQAELGFVLSELDIDDDPALQRAYFERIPVITLDGEELFDHFLDEGVLRERLESRR